MARLRFGILGMSPGNGHPYSWSAIFNGYDASAMADCPFPAIPEYLTQHRFPEEAIADAAVTHVWTQDRTVSTHIAAASRIGSIVDDPRDMIGQVDAVLLARDDAGTHFELAAPFLDAGLPIYIDKPLALTVDAARALYDRQKRPGQIFTCSALAYAEELQLPANEMAELGALRFVDAVTVNDWDRYAVHVIEPLCALLRSQGPIARFSAGGDKLRHLDVTWQNRLTARITALGVPHGPIAIRLFGDAGWRQLEFRDTFAAFRAALRHFTDIVLGKAPAQNASSVLEIIAMIEAGRRSP
jgi:predicted dehydrogenase